MPTESSPAEIPEIEAAQRIGLAQIVQLLESSQYDIAIDEIVTLMDATHDQLIKISADQPYERWMPLRCYMQDQLTRWQFDHPELMTLYRERFDEIARKEILLASKSRDLRDAIRASREYFATSFGDDALLLVADLAIDQGHTELARAALTRIDSRLQATGIGESVAAIVPAFSWNDILLRDPGNLDVVVSRIANRGGGFPFGCYDGSDLFGPELVARLVYCSILDGHVQRANRELSVARRLFPGDKVLTEEVARILDKSFPSSPLPQGQFSSSPQWITKLPAFKELPDETSSPSPPHLPIVWNGHVLITDGVKIFGFDLATGDRWPGAGTGGILFDGKEIAAEPRASATLRTSGSPRYSMEQDNNYLAAKIGSPITGWLPVIRRSSRSFSQIVVLNMKQEGRLLDAYPRRLESTALQSFEFEGTPIIAGDAVVSGILRTDGSLSTSHVISIDLRSGSVRWISPKLATSISSAPATMNRITHAHVTQREEQLFYHADLGTVASLCLQTGKLHWLVRYPRGESLQNPFRKNENRHAGSGDAVALDQEYAFVAPADCDRLFALNSATGQLLWTSGPDIGAGITQLVGVTEKHVIASGNRLLWIDKHTGNLDYAFPDGMSGQSKLDQQFGRAILFGKQIYWPRHDSLFILDASPRESTRGNLVRLDRILKLQPLGLSGGNLSISENHLILVSKNHVAVFPSIYPAARN